jgi:hypothetical protein
MIDRLQMAVDQIAITGATSVSINAGQSVGIPLTLIRSRVSEAISLGAIRLPQGLTATFSPASLPASTASQQFTLTLTAAATAPAAQATMQVVASGAGVTSAYASVPVTVTSPYSYIAGAPVITIGASGEATQTSQATITLAAFGQVSVPLNLEISAGVTGTISFALASLPSGITAGNGTSLLVTVPPTAASGPLSVVSPAGTASGAPEFAIDN